MKTFNTNQKLLKLNYLLQNSKTKTIPRNSNLVTDLKNDTFWANYHKHEILSSNSNANLEQDKNLLLSSSKNLSTSQKQPVGLDMTKDLSLFLSLIEKPINLLFSIDQFVFEFSKKTYQQKKAGEFFQQLKERKKLSLFYGNLTRKEIINLFNDVKKNKGYFSKNVFSLLERRLDVVLYRSGLTKTIAEARQLIKHKKILVNEKIINVPSFLLSPGDFVSITQKTVDFLSNQLVDSLKSKPIKNHPKIIGDFYSKLKKTLESSVSFENSKQSTSSVSLIENFRSKLLCNLLIKLLCTKIKLRSFWILKRQQGVSQVNLENSNKNSSKDLNNSFLTMFKWRSLAQNKNFLSRKLIENSDESLKRKKNQELHIYANEGCLQKRPVFWSRNFSDFKQNKIFYFKNSRKSVMSQDSYYQSDKKNLKFINFKKKNLGLYRKSFLIFLKYLENYKKFTSLVASSMNKNLLKKSSYKQKYSGKFSSKFSKKFTFRLLRPINMEISYNLLNLVYLYSPQRVNFPFYIDLDLIQRSLR